MEQKIAVLQEMLGFIDSKMNFYAGVRAGEFSYQSSLLAPVADVTVASR